MKTITVAFTALVASTTVSALDHGVHHPHHAHKRDLKLVTETKEVVKTEMVWQTVWVYPNGAPVASKAEAPPAALAPAPTAVSHPTPLPAVHTSQAAPAPPVQPAPKAKPAPVPAPAPAPKPAPVPAPKPAAVPAPAPAPVSGGTTYTGDMTYYDVGLGSCGWTSTPNEYIVAIPHQQMNNPANPNANPLCGKMVNIHYGGKSAKAKVVDTCGGCQPGDLDMSTSLFSFFAPMSAGRVAGMTWSYA